jgi:hypothetical protein
MCIIERKPRDYLYRAWEQEAVTSMSAYMQHRKNISICSHRAAIWGRPHTVTVLGNGMSAVRQGVFT